MSLAELLLIADGRLPAGGHAHSFGLEAAVRRLGVSTQNDVERFLDERTATVGFVEATATAMVCGHPDLDRAGFDVELDARMPSPAQRAASRQLGRQALRIGRVMWPDDAALAMQPPHRDGDHQAVVWGLLAAAARCTPTQAALVSLHHLTTAIASAAVRLLRLDPIEMHAGLLRRAAALDELADRCAELAVDARPDGLPAASHPYVDLLAELHHHDDERLFHS